MPSISETAKAYMPKKILTIAELPSVDTSLQIHEEGNAEHPYNYVEVEGQRFKVPNSVLSDLKEILEESPALKTFKVKKQGEGLNTRYTVIPLG